MTSPSAQIPRRHDLDALRAMAMLLGIVLHGLISFMPGAGVFWGVQDIHTSPAFGVLMAAIHGWRMPLFFLVSGFFTAMLWRKRGLKALVWHRFRRILVPMLLGMLTIIPATWMVVAHTRSATTQVFTVPSSSLDIWGAAAFNDVEALRRNLGEGANIDGLNPDGSAPLHIAAFFGRADVARELLEAGADARVRNAQGQTARELMQYDWKLTKYFADMFHIPVEKAAVEAGREEIALLLPVGDVDASTNLHTEVSSGNKFGKALQELIAGLMFIQVFGHLWFLWFLCWLVAGFTLLMKVGQWTSFPSLPRAWIVSPWRYLWLIPLTAIPQFFMGRSTNTFGPDTSLGLLPIPTVLMYYSIFFLYGAMYFDAQDTKCDAGRGWWWVVPLAVLVVFPVALSIKPHGDGGLKLLSAFLQVSYAWLMTFGLMGLFHRFCSSENGTMRYVSDSSYWLYLAHIPLIMYVQHWVHDWQVSAWIKFPLVCVVTSVILLASYQLCVRYTPIGVLLNGPRRREVVIRPVPAEC